MCRGVMGLENFFLSYYVKDDLIWLYYNTCLNLINLIFSKLAAILESKMATINIKYSNIAKCSI